MTRAPGAARRARLLLLPPYLWLLVFFCLPCLIAVKISLAEQLIAQPPYGPLIDFSDAGRMQIRATLEHYRFLLADDLYWRALLGSVRIAGVSALLCLLLGYPMAYAITRAPRVWRLPLLMAVVLPFWTSFLLRVYAWMGLLGREGLVNQLLQWGGLSDTPLVLLRTEAAVYLGIVYAYLPFMVLPLYANLEKHDRSLLAAAADLGATPLRAFLTVTLPLSLPGISAGLALVFIPALGEFVIPDLLGGPDTLMLGKVLWDEFFGNRAWPLAAAVATAMLLLVAAAVVVRACVERMLRPS